MTHAEYVHSLMCRGHEFTVSCKYFIKKRSKGKIKGPKGPVAHSLNSPCYNIPIGGRGQKRGFIRPEAFRLILTPLAIQGQNTEGP